MYISTVKISGQMMSILLNIILTFAYIIMGEAIFQKSQFVPIDTLKKFLIIKKPYICILYTVYHMLVCTYVYTYDMVSYTIALPDQSMNIVFFLISC